MSFLRRALRLLGMTLPAVMTGALVLIVVADVAARNLLRVTIPWAHDLAVVLLAAAVWFGMVGAAATGQLFGITVLTDRLPPALRQPMLTIADLLVILIAAAVIHAAQAQIATARFTTFLSLGWPKWILALILALGMGGIILDRLLAIAERLRQGRERA